ncbi:hypothetical protein CBL_13957 [Carabus blaptoides fortunei]
MQHEQDIEQFNPKRRKQLMALIVARKKGKENVVDAILNEVNRERAGKKVKHIQQTPFIPMVSAGHVRRLDYNNTTYLRNMSPPACKRAKTNQTLKKSKASMQGARYRQQNVGPSTSNLSTPQQFQEQFPLSPMEASEPMPSTTRRMLEHNLPISSVVNPYQAYIVDTLTDASNPNRFVTFDNSTHAPGWPSTGYPFPSMWVVSIKTYLVQKKSNIMDFEASIQPLSSDEEMLIYNSLDDIDNIDLSISETYHQIMASQHNTQCLNNQITCPFFYTECNWLDTVPLMAFHIRRMHQEKIVHKNKAEYVINFLQLAALGDRGVKIIQDYNNRMFFISLCLRKLIVYVTLQEVCESVDQHAEKSKGKLIIKLQNGIKYWSGEAHSMYYPLAKLLTPESSLEMPMSFFNGQLSKHFRLYVEIEI